MTVNEEKPNIRRTQSHEPRRTNQPSFPLMQIAEKYRKELRDLSKGGGLLPVHLQKESEEEVKKEPETPELENISKDEVDLVREANNKDDLETAVDRDLRNTETSAGSVFCCLFVCLFVCLCCRFFFFSQEHLLNMLSHTV